MLRADWLYATRRSVGRGARADQAAMLTYTGGDREVIRHEAGCVRPRPALTALFQYHHSLRAFRVSCVPRMRALRTLRLLARAIALVA